MSTTAPPSGEQADTAPESASLVERLFRVRGRGSTPRTELVAGASMFMAAAYAVVVVPGQLAGAGVPHGAATTAVIIAIALATLAMGLIANLPFVVAPGLGGVALIAFTIVGQDHVPWDTALGMVFWSGVAFLVLTLLGIRDLVTRLMPMNLKYAISGGLGLYIALIGFRDADLVVGNADKAALAVGDLSKPAGLLALGGLLLLTALAARKVPGAFLITIAAVTVVGIPSGSRTSPTASSPPPPRPGHCSSTSTSSGRSSRSTSRTSSPSLCPSSSP